MNNLWPPPINGLSMTEMLQLKTIAKDFLQILEREIPARCKAQGHEFSTPKPCIIVVREGTWNEPNPGVFLDRGYYDDREEVPGFERTCVICGVTEKKPSIIHHSSPF